MFIYKKQPSTITNCNICWQQFDSPWPTMNYSTASKLKSELETGLSQKKSLSIEDRISKGKRLIEEYVPQLEKTNKEKAEAYKEDIQKLINKLNDTPQAETVKSSDNEINDIDKEPLKEEPQMKEPEVKKGPEVK